MGQVCWGVATAAFLIGSGAGFALGREGGEQAQGRRLLLVWVWYGGAVVGVGALPLGILARGLASGPGSAAARGWPLASVVDRAALVALMAGLLSLGPVVRDLARREQGALGWAEWIPIAIVSGVSVLGRSAETVRTTAPFLLICTLVAAGLTLWSAGQGLGVLIGVRRNNRRAATVAFVGLTVSVVVVGMTNWRVWGTPVGTVAAAVCLPAAWLLGASRLVLSRKSAWLVSLLDLLVAGLLVAIASSVRWTLPFS